MLHILLAILKIIGIILLVIIGLILLICACILFVPIRYGACVKYENTPDIKVKVTYLLHIISICAGYQDKSLVKELRIFGIRTHFLDDKHQGEKRKKRDRQGSTDFGSQAENDDEQLEQDDLFDEIDIKKQNGFINRSKRRIRKSLYKRKKNKEIKKQNLIEDEYLGIYETERDLRDLDNVQILEDNFFESVGSAGRSASKETESARQDAGENESEEKDGRGDTGEENIFSTIKSKIIQIIHKIQYHFGKICGTIRKASEGIGKVRSNVDHIFDIINDEVNREAFTFVKGEVFKALGHIRPRQVKGYVRFGFDDPYNTGRLLGIIYAVLKGTKKSFQLMPDFDNQVLEADVSIKGRIQLYYLLIIAYRIYKNENFKKAFERRRKNGGQ